MLPNLRRSAIMVNFEFYAYFSFKIWASQMLYSKRHHEELERAGVRRSKLELYEDILTALADKPLTVDTIAYACNLDCIALRQRLNFLAKNDMVEEKNYKKRKRYALTRRGLAIFKTLTITRRLEKLQTTIKKMDDALKVIPALSEYNEEKTKRPKRNENY
jgi:predicted transcriptional regulator